MRSTNNTVIVNIRQKKTFIKEMKWGVFTVINKRNTLQNQTVMNSQQYEKYYALQTNPTMLLIIRELCK